MSVRRPDLSFEIRTGSSFGWKVCGVDEVGRGPLAGPVVAAAVILAPGGLPEEVACLINDSKQLSGRMRMRLEPEIRAHAVAVALGSASVQEIFTLNILQAALLAMSRAVAALAVTPDHVLIDGRQIPLGLPCPATAIIRGDRISQSIAAASIIAKVFRDNEMSRLSQEYPQFNWGRNAGYPTAEHLAALRRYGPTCHHRASFAPVREQLLVTR
ncbi:MAG: ribonuclease HII [Rhodospirillaceae bacterium]